MPTSTGVLGAPFRLRFGHRSKRWGGGGVAFVESDQSPRHETVFRLYRVRVSQYCDILAQENRIWPPVDLDPDDLAAMEVGEHVDVYDSLYCRTLKVASNIDGADAFTITTNGDLADLRPPHVSYRATLEVGLSEMGKSPAETQQYLDERVA